MHGLPKKCALFTLCWALFCGTAAAVEYKSIMPGMELGFLSATESVRSGDGRIAVLKVDPARFRFKVLAAGSGQPGFTAGQWREQTGALAVFNAGQYATDGTYLGLLISGGKAMGRLVTRLEGLFVAEPVHGQLPPARVVDLRYTAFDAQRSPYREAAQSLMLLDRFGHIRVRRSPRVAHRTLVAWDAKGNILVLVSEGGHTLWELARFISQAGLSLREVMCMDGGAESQLAIKAPGFSYDQYGVSGQLPIPWPKVPLPVAVGVFPRKK